MSETRTLGLALGAMLGAASLLGCSTSTGDDDGASGTAADSGTGEGTTGGSVNATTSASPTSNGEGDDDTGPGPMGSTDETGVEPGSSGDAADTAGTDSGATTTGADACANGVVDSGESDVDCGGPCPACPIGSQCDESEDCADNDCASGSCVGQSPTCDLDDVQNAPGNNWSDSYSVDGNCYCASTFDHDIGEIEVETPVGTRTVLEICDAIGPGPGIEGNPVYNDIQCGNGPANNAGDEDWCPGRVDQGEAGCCTVGPTWDLSLVP